VASVFEMLDEQNDLITECRASEDPVLRAKVKARRLIGPATKQRIRATLRSALGTYMKQHPGVLSVNAAALVELPSGKRPSHWYGPTNGSALQLWISIPRPSPVMVWTPAQTSGFLIAARRHRLYALFHLIAFRGPRRGEACGLRRQDTDLKNRITTIRWQIVQLGWDTEQGEPKTEAGERQLALDRQTVAVIRGHRTRQDAERDQAGDSWTGSGFAFTNPDGSALHPAAVTDAFEQIAYLAGLPRSAYITCATSPRHSLAAGVDIKVVQEQLGHSSRAVTSDTYTSVLPEVARAAAEASAALMGLSNIAAKEHATSPHPGK
jgi:integrase